MSERRPSQNTYSQGNRRPSQTTGNRRPAQGGSNRRPPQGGGRRRRKRVQTRFYVILALVILAIIGVILAFTLPKRGGDPVVAATPAPVAGTDVAGVVDASTATDETHSTLADWLGDEDANVAGLSSGDMVDVADLSVNTSLPSEWMNVLLLGTDARDVNASCRTDTMIVCSINTTTGEVKLTSLARDTAVTFDDIGKYNGTYRINAANYFGGPKLAVKTVNECLDLNITSFVMVNFYGFQYIAENLGGIDIDITQAEMDQINIWQHQQYRYGLMFGIDESGLVNEDLTTYGANTHLNGRQTLAYCRIRKIDSDFARTERQRTVLMKLLEKVKSKNAVEITALAAAMQPYFSTNLGLEDIVRVAMVVLQGNASIGSDNQLRLPLNNTYVQETRNEQSMLYDTDWKKNAQEIYNFIYA